APCIPRLRALAPGPLTESDLAALVGSTSLGRLRRLHLLGALRQIKDLSPMASWPGFSGLTHLDLRNNGLEADQLGSLLTTGNLEHLVSLNLYNNSRLRDDAASLVARSTRLLALTDLDLGSCGVGVEGVRALVKAKRLDALRRLDLGSANLGIRGAE